MQNDQSIKKDAGKIRPTLVPTQIIKDIAEVREFGCIKYERESWRRVSIERYNDALCRHLLEYLNNPDSVDEESGLPHYKHIACNLAFICQLLAERKDNE